MNQIALPFDYSGIEPKLASAMQAIEGRIRSRNATVMDIMVETGRDLLSVRDQIERGKFQTWVESRCGLSKSGAYRLMNVAERLADELPTVGRLPPSAIYELAAPTTPDPVRHEIVARLKSGEDIAPEKIIETVRESRDAERKAKADAKLTPEELKQQQQKERRQRKSREQREADNAREREEAKQSRMRRANAIQTAAQMIIERLEPDALKDLVLLLREGHGHGADDFTNFLAEAVGMDLPRLWRHHFDMKLRGEW